ncbi:hypothetical protein RchiOBHm_Chr6g0254011 [Rosa chinensis]|uniref:Uncharacterized protein n=1 Tax=Rosa chinensis TaxID=74649 RepID=A0A2P6PLH4_ROSCH|nr:hypothetical protein RchiOBHm_Chr6g0254011 [Rosa chinensis]
MSYFINFLRLIFFLIFFYIFFSKYYFSSFLFCFSIFQMNIKAKPSLSGSESKDSDSPTQWWFTVHSLTASLFFRRPLSVRKRSASDSSISFLK